ncbi:MAG: hypothetical protein ACRC10_07390 [Thermoguttaceae bacterium]
MTSTSLHLLLTISDPDCDVLTREKALKRLGNSEEIQSILRRIEQVRSCCKPVPPAQELDPNLVAEYLDYQLPRDDQALFEETVLESDVLLAELVCCYSIITHSLKNPAQVPSSCRQRLYDLPNYHDFNVGETKAQPFSVSSPSSVRFGQEEPGFAQTGQTAEQVNIPHPESAVPLSNSLSDEIADREKKVREEGKEGNRENSEKREKREGGEKRENKTGRVANKMGRLDHVEKKREETLPRTNDCVDISERLPTPTVVPSKSNVSHPQPLTRAQSRVGDALNHWKNKRLQKLQSITLLAVIIALTLLGVRYKSQIISVVEKYGNQSNEIIAEHPQKMDVSLSATTNTGSLPPVQKTAVLDLYSIEQQESVVLNQPNSIQPVTPPKSAFTPDSLPLPGPAMSEFPDNPTSPNPQPTVVTNPAIKRISYEAKQEEF